MLLINTKMFKQKDIVEYALSIDIPIIGFASTTNNHEMYLKHLQQKIATKTLYPRKQEIEQYYDVFNVLEDAKTIISIGISYAQESKYHYQKNSATFSITSYGLDYHKVVFEKMKRLVDFLKVIDSNLEAYYQCDTGVLDDRYFAYLCKNGIYGKHSQIINPNYGSQVFYGTIIINKEVAIENTSFINDLCQDCRLCLDVCPTNSIDNYKVNYHSCLSYLSQSHHLIDPKLLNNCFYGCDLCSSVCPYNKLNSYDKAFEEEQAHVDIIDFLLLSKNKYQAIYKNKSFSWLNRNILRKNLILLLDLNDKDLKELEKKMLDQHSSKLLKEAFDYKKSRL